MPLPPERWANILPRVETQLTWQNFIELSFSQSQTPWQSQRSSDYDGCKEVLLGLVCWAIVWPYGNATVRWLLWFFGVNFEVSFSLLSVCHPCNSASIWGLACSVPRKQKTKLLCHRDRLCCVWRGIWVVPQLLFLSWGKKCPNRSNLREWGCILAHGQKVSPSWQGSPGSRGFRQLVTWHP